MSRLAFRTRRAALGQGSPTIPTAPVGGIDYDPTAWAHYRFGTDNPTMVDANGQNAMSVVGAAPAQSGSFLTVPYGANAITTPFADRHGWSALIVVRAFTSASAGRQVLLSHSGTTPNAGLTLINQADIAYKYNGVAGIGVTFNQVEFNQQPGMVDGTSWVALAIHDRQGPGERRFAARMGEQEPAETVVRNAADGDAYAQYYRPLQTGALAIGGAGIFAGQHSHALDVAALIVFDRELTDDEMAAVYLAEQAQLAKRGIAVL